MLGVIVHCWCCCCWSLFVCLDGSLPRMFLSFFPNRYLRVHHGWTSHCCWRSEICKKWFTKQLFFQDGDNFSQFFFSPFSMLGFIHHVPKNKTWNFCNPMILTQDRYPPETTNIALKVGLPKRKIVSQTEFFRGYVRFRKCIGHFTRGSLPSHGRDPLGLFVEPLKISLLCQRILGNCTGERWLLLGQVLGLYENKWQK